MVFSSLTQRDKDAFFALLDEYFESRPGLLNGSTTVTSQVLSASHTGSSSVKATQSTPPRPPARTLSTSTNGSSATGGGNSTFKPRSVPPAPPSRAMTPRIVEPVEQRSDNEDVDEAPVSVSSRIAAAQAGIGMGTSTFSTAGRPPVPGSRRTSAQSVASAAPSSPTTSTPAAAPPPPSRASRVPAGLNTPPPPSSTNTPAANGLVSSRGIGSIDTSSGGAAVGSVFSFKGMGKNGPPKGAPGTVITPPAFEKPKTRDTFAPPPRRDVSGGTSPVPAPRRNLVAEPEPAQEEEESQGEWVEALYDLAAAEPTDLSFKAGDQIWVTERTSKDWWMAEIDGKAGLVPATYVKPL